MRTTVYLPSARPVTAIAAVTFFPPSVLVIVLFSRSRTSWATPCPACIAPVQYTRYSRVQHLTRVAWRQVEKCSGRLAAPALPVPGGPQLSRVLQHSTEQRQRGGTSTSLL